VDAVPERDADSPFEVDGGRKLRLLSGGGGRQDGQEEKENQTTALLAHDGTLHGILRRAL
jgi:hypothetical protein